MTHLGKEVFTAPDENLKIDNSHLPGHVVKTVALIITHWHYYANAFLCRPLTTSHSTVQRKRRERPTDLARAPSLSWCERALGSRHGVSVRPALHLSARRLLYRPTLWEALPSSLFLFLIVLRETVSLDS